MKTVIKIFIFGIVSILSICNINAQHKSYSNNNIVFWGSGGLNALSANLPNLNAKWDVGYGVGVGYEFQYKKFSILTGVEYTKLKSSLEMDKFSIDVDNLFDDEGDRFRGHYTFSDNSDTYKLGNINFPLEIGYRTNKFYFLTGVKLGINLLATSKTESLIDFSGTYENFLGTFENMPNHSFANYNATNDFPTILTLNCSATAEAGLSFGKKTNWRLGAFFDYGIQNVNGNALQNLILYGTGNLPYLNDYMTGYAMPTTIMYGGLKLTVLLKLNKKTDCNCDIIPSNKKRRR